MIVADVFDEREDWTQVEVVSKMVP